MKLNIFLLESSLLFILVIHTFRSIQLTNQLAFLTTAPLLMFFLLISFARLNPLKFARIRLWCLIFILILVLGFALVGEVNSRSAGKGSVHDGVIVTEAAYRALISGRNPYSANFANDLNREKYDGQAPQRATVNYPYSPMMFLAGVPIFLITDNLFKIIDMRIVLVTFFLFTSFVGALMVREKILFLILFLLNPLFVPLMYYGANDIIMLFFLFLLLYFLRLRRESWATAMLGLATGTKLLILPLTPLYFLYLFISFKKIQTERLVKQIAIFIFVNLLIYLPFVFWNTHDLVDDLIFPWFGQGEYTHPIAGYLGVPQILNRIGLIASDSALPFFVMAIPFELIFLILALRVLKKSCQISTLCVLMAANFILVLSFSRLLQTYYLAFISEIFLFASFVYPFF